MKAIGAALSGNIGLELFQAISENDEQAQAMYQNAESRREFREHDSLTPGGGHG